MRVDVVMPKLGESITEGTIISWRKKPGEKIGRDEILLEIGTDKVDSEIPSPAAGVVVEILAKPSEVVAVDTVIARIETEVLAAEAKPVAPPSTPPPPRSPVAAPTPILPLPPVVPVPHPVTERRERIYFTPLVRSIAKQEGIGEEELSAIAGTGQGGRVTKSDLLAYVERKRSSRLSPVAVPSPLPAPPTHAPAMIPLAEEIVEMDRMRQIIAQHMRSSVDTAAHVHLMSECDMTRIAALIQSRQAEFERREGFRLTFTPFFAMAAVRTILAHPIFNASLEGNRIHRHKNIHLGIAVSLEKGLMVPVIRNCEELNFLGLCRKVNDLAHRARAGRVSPDELQGSTFSITNFGIFGNLFGTPIINVPNAAILGIGAVRKRPVVRETDSGDAIVIRSMTVLSLGFDHRLVDGSDGGAFLKTLVANLETMDLGSLL